MAGLWNKVLNLVGGGPRAAGPPRSRARASSFHLIWELPGPPVGPPPAERRLVEVVATLEVLVPPQVEALYFWALQVDLADGRGIWGGAHTGLQWNRRYPGSRAVNWGGYTSADLGGGVLAGSTSPLPGFADDPHTLGYRWEPGRPYRFRVYPSAERAGGWRAEITDQVSGATSVIRDLFPPVGRGSGSFYLARPIVWSEVFADCDAPSVTVRWSELEALDAGGTTLRPESVTVNYQAASEGGCPNTTVAADEVGVLQITAVERTAPAGGAVLLPQTRDLTS